MSVPGTSGGVVVDASVRRVLVYRLGSLGDTLVALPSLHLVARAFPNAERRMLTNIPVASLAPAAAAVLGDSGLIHSYENYPVGLRSPWRLLAVLLRLLRFRPEVVVYLKATTDAAVARRDAMFLRLTGARRMIGMPARDTDLVPVPSADGTFEPEAYRLARSIGELGNADVDSRAAWDLRLSSAEKARAQEVLQPLEHRPFFAVSVGTKVQSKDWGISNWTRFLQALATAYPGRALLLAGAREEASATEAASEGWKSVPHAGPAVNVCGLLTPRQTAAVFERADLFIGHDSGPMHLAAVVGTPTVAIFAARNKPRTWFPVSAPHCVLYHRVDCWGCGLETCLEQRKKCLLSITVDEVLEGVHTMMRTLVPASSRTRATLNAAHGPMIGGIIHAA